jgi:hypothetical protein
MIFIEKIVTATGYDNVNHFIDSAFHTKSTAPSLITATGLTGFAWFVESILGLNLPIFLVLIILFAVELMTGIKSSYKEGYGWCTNKFERGWLKLFLYFLMMGTTFTLAAYYPIQPYFGVEFNHFKWINYIFTNYIFVNLLLSILENFVRLGWNDRFGIINSIAEGFNLHVLKKKKDERKISE